MENVYYSDRQTPLMFQGECLDRPVLSVERYEKWYSYWLVNPDKTVTRVPFDYSYNFEALEEKPTYCAIDHCPNPKWMVAICNASGWYVDDLSLELVIGRWINEQHPLSEVQDLDFVDVDDVVGYSLFQPESLTPARPMSQEELQALDRKLKINSFSGAFVLQTPKEATCVVHRRELLKATVNRLWGSNKEPFNVEIELASAEQPVEASGDKVVFADQLKTTASTMTSAQSMRNSNGKNFPTKSL